MKRATPQSKRRDLEEIRNAIHSRDRQILVDKYIEYQQALLQELIDQNMGKWKHQPIKPYSWQKK